MIEPNFLRNNFKYTGVGARVTPTEVCDFMTLAARNLAAKGFTLRSGGQMLGADGAFERGAGHKKEIYRPESKRRIGELKTLPEAYKIAQAHHSAWDYLPPFIKELMARNVHAALGPDLDDPSEFVICWTADAMIEKKQRTKKSGGTGHTIDVALTYGIPILNLCLPEHREYVEHVLMK